MSFVEAIKPQLAPISTVVEADVREPIAVERHEWKGSVKLDVRHWYSKADGSFGRTKKGVSIPLEEAEALLAALVEVVNEAAECPHTFQLVRGDK